MALPSPPPTLCDDVVGEILRRLPPDEPTSLVHASLVCKPWHLLLYEPSFPCCYRELHCTPRVLGFLYNKCFIPTTATNPPLSPPAFDCFSWVALDCRHGHVLLHTMDLTCLVIWDPITGEKHFLPEVSDEPCNHLTAAVLRAVNGYDHINCHGGPFLVVYGSTADEDVMDDASVTWMSVYSFETRVWSVPTWIHLGPISRSQDVMGPSLLVGSVLYFLLEDGRRILKYDLGVYHLSIMNTPPLHVGNMALVKVNDGGLGVTGVEGYNLHLWSWRGAAGWVQGRFIELDMMLSMDIGDPSTKLLVVGFLEGANTIFISAKPGSSLLS